jgi:hypothetical protein
MDKRTKQFIEKFKRAGLPTEGQVEYYNKEYNTNYTVEERREMIATEWTT